MRTRAAQHAVALSKANYYGNVYFYRLCYCVRTHVLLKRILKYICFKVCQIIYDVDDIFRHALVLFSSVYF